jgi:hypothetical protein
VIVLKETGKYLRMHASAYLFFFIISVLLIVDLFLAGIQEIPFVYKFGLTDFARGEWFTLFFMLGLITWKLSSHYLKGLKGEAHVSDFLKQRLGNEYYILNDVTFPNSYGNIDHIITSRNGIFVVETKNISGIVKFNDYENWNLGGRSPIAQVRGNARSLYYQIKFSVILSQPMKWIDGIVVFPEAEVTKSNPNTLACTLNNLPECLNKLSSNREQYSQEDLDKINDYILNSAEKAELENSFTGIIWKDFRALFNLQKKV